MSVCVYRLKVNARSPIHSCPPTHFMHYEIYHPGNVAYSYAASLFGYGAWLWAINSLNQSINIAYSTKVSAWL